MAGKSTSSSRRELLIAAALSGAALAGCSQIEETKLGKRFLPLRRDNGDAITPVAHPDSHSARFLNRVAYGATASDAAQLKRLGRAEFLAAQLKAPTDDSGEPLGLLLRLRGIDAYRYTAYELRDLKDNVVLMQMQKAAILRAVYSPWQLRERMADFWTNHFNIYGRKAYGAWMKPADDRDVIRKYALGKFPEMLSASARSPAMLAYLDNKLNRSGVANENYAREIMELHTLGVANATHDGTGGYTQKDVQEVARCFTGWTIEEGFLKRRGTFLYDDTRHDAGEKWVLGHKIPAGGGQEDGNRVLHILAHHPNTARFISGKIVRYFLGRKDAEWTNRLADIYLKTGGDIPTMLTPLLLSDTILNDDPILKRPFDYMVSALRVTNSETDGGESLQTHLAQMGQPLFQWPMPDGYPDKTQAWTGTLIHRWNFALALLTGEIKGTKPVIEQDANLSKLIPSLYQLPLTDSVVAHLSEKLAHLENPAELTAMLLCAPPFQWR